LSHNRPPNQLQVSQSAQVFTGPLPPPEQLIKYNEAVPNAAERIIAMAEKQSAHRQQLETIALREEAKRSSLGLAAAFILSVLALSASTFCIYTCHDVAGSSIFGASLASIVIAFLRGTASRRSEREVKMKMQTQQTA
jgi:uncharacterized membrane protein